MRAARATMQAQSSGAIFHLLSSENTCVFLQPAAARARPPAMRTSTPSPELNVKGAGEAEPSRSSCSTLLPRDRGSVSRVAPAPAPGERASCMPALTDEQMAQLQRVARRSQGGCRTKIEDFLWAVADHVLVVGLSIALVLWRWAVMPWRNFKSFRARKWMFDHQSRSMRMWETFIAVIVLYSAIYIPLELVFEEEARADRRCRLPAQPTCLPAPPPATPHHS